MSKSAKQAPTPAASVIQNITGKGSKQETDDTAGSMPNEKLYEFSKGRKKLKENGTRPIRQTAENPPRMRKDISLKVKTMAEATKNLSQKRLKSTTNEEGLSQPWLCEETNPFTVRIQFEQEARKVHATPKNHKGNLGNGYNKVQSTTANVRLQREPKQEQILGPKIHSGTPIEYQRGVSSDKAKERANAEKAFQEMKQCIADLRMLTAPKPKEELIMYLCATREAINVTLFIDGSSCLEGSGAGLILTNPEGVEFTYALRFEFVTSNNKAEYEALVTGLQIAKQMGVKNLVAKVYSHLMANKIDGSYIVNEQSMIQYLEKSKALITGFKTFSIEQVPRSENKKADALSKIASTSFAHLTKHVLVEVLKEKSIDEKEIFAIVEEEGYTWMKQGTLPVKTKKA
uniref:Reverse transcriptase domain-containing protein n=1 Tax=Tanacetum cinerariifolium TaxID=118510 RepID=A0A6L2NWA3_TANCI|nr:reverse transcriptase domain-containing protein [Tanacetum cinerariifolium]